MLFPALEIEPIVQVNDRTRLSATKTYGSRGGGVISKVEIQPEAGADFIDISSPKYADWFTDWQYATPGSKVITLRLNDPAAPVLKTHTIIVVSEADDMLFSADGDLIQEEPDILKYVKAGRNSFKDVHREAQRQIIEMLDRKGYRGAGGARVSKEMVVDRAEVREMSKYLALYIIFNGQQNQVDDIHAAKARTYDSRFRVASQRQIVGLDLNGDGVLSSGEGVSISTSRLVRS